MKRLTFVLILVICSTPQAEGQVAQGDTAVHVVRTGDTLWDLAEQYLRNPYLWPQIFEVNRDVVANPNRIFPAERLRIPGLVVQPGEAVVETSTGLANRTVFFPSVQQVSGPRVGDLVSAAVPAVRPGDFYRAGFLIPDEELAAVGQLLEVVSPSVIPRESPRAIQRYDRVLMKVSGPGVAAGDRIQLVRRDRAVGEYGRIFLSAGLASVAAVNGEIATVVIDEMHLDVAPGDMALPVDFFPVEAGVRPQPAQGPQGMLLAFQSAHALHSIEDLAFVDMGEDSGLKEGDELVAVLPSSRAEWGTRPEVEVARLQVIRVGRRTAAVRVIELEQPALQAGLPVRLVSKMP